MGTKIDIRLGQIFGCFHIIEIIKRSSRKYGRYVYRIKCNKCPYERTVESCSLSKLKSCNFCHIYEKIGSRNGRLIFEEYLGKSLYKAKCDCGNYCNVRLKSSSCGCDHKEKRPLSYKDRSFIIESLFGVKSGRLTIKNYLGKGKKGLKYLATCKCGNLSTIYKSQLFIKNSCGCLQKESVPRGSKKPNAKYTEFEVASMKELYLSGTYNIKEISDIFQIQEGSLRKILRNKSWKHAEVSKDILKNAKSKLLNYVNSNKKHTRYDYNSLINRKFGSYTIIEILDNKGKGKRGIVLCDCGYKNEILLYPLISRKTKSCHQCSIKHKDFSYLIGKKYGCRTILSITNTKKLKGLVKCDCGNEKEILLHHIMQGIANNSCEKCYKKGESK